ncbi:MAG TPA: hypothetical protein QF353_06010 [Gammaproteobacteria bacterium]|nr:hypothetical protein [Gammaproteobacteria bacterium]
MSIRSDLRLMMSLYQDEVLKSDKKSKINQFRLIDIQKLKDLLQKKYTHNVLYSELVKFKKGIRFRRLAWFPYLVFLPYSRFVSRLDIVLKDYGKDKVISSLKDEIRIKDQTLYETIEEGKRQVSIVGQQIEHKFSQDLNLQQAEIKSMGKLIKKLSEENIELKGILRSTQSYPKKSYQDDFNNLKTIVQNLSHQMKGVLVENKALRNELRCLKELGVQGNDEAISQLN